MAELRPLPGQHGTGYVQTELLVLCDTAPWQLIVARDLQTLERGTHEGCVTIKHGNVAQPLVEIQQDVVHGMHLGSKSS